MSKKELTKDEVEYVVFRYFVGNGMMVARDNKNYELSDKIRTFIEDMGYRVSIRKNDFTISLLVKMRANIK